MTDNFTNFRNFMQLPETEGGDAYYVIELVRRGKDNPDLPAANYHFKNYYIDTLDKDDKHWIVDIDDCPFNIPSSVQKRASVIRIIEGCEPEGRKLETMLPTRTGAHLITRPFNLGQFQSWCMEELGFVPDVQKNHLTLLFEDL